MGDSTIEWCDKVWNPIRGCSMVSQGCERCYAMKQAHRFSGPGRAYEGLTELGPSGPRWTGTIKLVPEHLEQPLHWRKPARIFVNSMSDLFHEEVPFDFIDKVFAVMALCPQHTFQVLTKRADRMFDYCAARHGIEDISPLPNVWLGVSVENQRTADERLPDLLATWAAHRWVSLEPMLEAVDLSPWLRPGRRWQCGACRRYCREWANKWSNDCPHCGRVGYLCGSHAGNGAEGSALDWVVVGAESGPGVPAASSGCARWSSSAETGACRCSSSSSRGPTAART